MNITSLLIVLSIWRTLRDGNFTLLYERARVYSGNDSKYMYSYRSSIIILLKMYRYD